MKILSLFSMLFILLLVSFQSFSAQQEEALPSWRVKISPHLGFSATYTCNESGRADRIFLPFKAPRSDKKSRIMLNFRLEKGEEVVGVLSGQISLSPEFWNVYQTIDFLRGTNSVEFFKESKGLGIPSNSLKIRLTFDELDEDFYLNLKEREGNITDLCIKILQSDGDENQKKLSIE
jgi:hypothetical protein